MELLIYITQIGPAECTLGVLPLHVGRYAGINSGGYSTYYYYVYARGYFWIPFDNFSTDVLFPFL